MKKRMGFVSNSSSSSFCILGVSFDSDGEIVNLWNSKHPEDHVGKSYELEYDRKLEDLVIQTGIEGYYGMYIVGKYVTHLDYDRTITEQRKEIAEKMNSILGLSLTEKEIYFHIDGGRDS